MQVIKVTYQDYSLKVCFKTTKAFFQKLSEGKPFAVMSIYKTPTWLNPSQIHHAQPTGEQCL